MSLEEPRARKAIARRRSTSRRLEESGPLEACVVDAADCGTDSRSAGWKLSAWNACGALFVDAVAAPDCPLAAAMAALLTAGGCCDVVTIAFTTRSRTPGALGFGTALRASATTPATCGAAIEVPLIVAKAPTLVVVAPEYPVGTVDVTLWPGATTCFSVEEEPA